MVTLASGGYHPLLAIAAGTGDVLMSRLREAPGQHRSGRRPLPAGDRGPGAPCWELAANSRCGPTAASMPSAPGQSSAAR